MGDIITDIKNNFRRGNIFVRLIYVNVGVFLVTTILFVFFQLFNKGEEIGSVVRLFELPASFQAFIRQPWSLVSYMFMHGGVMHILFNMLCLYWFGSIFLFFFSTRHLRGLYFLGGLCGGIVYMLAYNIFPYLQGGIAVSSMVGASASIIAIIVAVAYREPNYPVNLLLLGKIRLKYVALIMILMSFMLLASDNAGGNFAHLGGALAGYCFALALNKGTDITSWINKALDALSSLFDKKTWVRMKKKPKMEVHYNRDPRDYEYNANKRAQSDEVDRILDKLKKSGYDSLTTEEKKSLFDASKR